MNEVIKDNDLCLLTRLFWPDAFGGVERRTRCMAEAFVGAGVDVSVITGTEPTQRKRSERIDPGYAVARVPRPDVGWRWRWRERIETAWWARALRAHPRRRWVWATDLMAAAGAVRAGLSDRLVYNPPWCAAGLDALGRSDRSLESLRCRPGLLRAERKVYDKARLVVASSRNLTEQLSCAYGERSGVHVVPHGVEPATEPTMTRQAARQALGVDLSDFVIGIVCRVEPVKDIPFLFRALQRVGDAVDRLLIVGDGPQRGAIEVMAAEMNLTGRITWTGRLADPTVAYRAMDVSVLPSVYESFGNVVLESMAVGTPVIGRRRDADAARPVLVANDEIIEHRRSGLLADAHDPCDMADALRELAGDADLRQELSSGARRAADRATWERATEQYLEIIGGGCACESPSRRRAA